MAFFEAVIPQTFRARFSILQRALSFNFTAVWRHDTALAPSFPWLPPPTSLPASDCSVARLGSPLPNLASGRKQGRKAKLGATFHHLHLHHSLPRAVPTAGAVRTVSPTCTPAQTRTAHVPPAAAACTRSCHGPTRASIVQGNGCAPGVRCGGFTRTGGELCTRTPTQPAHPTTGGVAGSQRSHGGACEQAGGHGAHSGARSCACACRGGLRSHWHHACSRATATSAGAGVHRAHAAQRESRLGSRIHCARATTWCCRPVRARRRPGMARSADGLRFRVLNGRLALLCFPILVSSLPTLRREPPRSDRRR